MIPRQMAGNLLKRIPITRELMSAYELMDQLRDCPGARKPGHYQSPIPSLSQIQADRERIFTTPEELPGVDLNAQGQLALGMELAPFMADCSFPEKETPPYRYFGSNEFFSWGDALVLNAMIRHWRPARILEVGSGFSSAMILDTVERHLAGKAHCTFIEPHPERLQSLLRPDDCRRCKLIVDRVQAVGLESFRDLSVADILLIDSSHTSKVGSDVNWLLFEVLPRVAPGVLVHVHDVFFPFEYPEDWFETGYAVNEAYLLRAFLTFNKRYEIVFWNDYLKKCHSEWLNQHLPGCFRGWSSSIWLRVKDE